MNEQDRVHEEQCPCYRENGPCQCSPDFRALAERYEVVEAARHAAYTDLARLADRNNRPCTHVTLRPGHLPCPHPECWTGPARAFFLDPKPPPSAYRHGPEADPATARRAHAPGAYYRRERFDMHDRGRPEGPPREGWGWFPE